MPCQEKYDTILSTTSDNLSNDIAVIVLYPHSQNTIVFRVLGVDRQDFGYFKRSYCDTAIAEVVSFQIIFPGNYQALAEESQ